MWKMKDNQDLHETTMVSPDDKFTDLANLLPETVFQIDAQGNLTFINNTGFQMFGYQPFPLEKDFLPENFFIPEDRQRLNNNLKQRLKGVPGKRDEYTALKADGSTFPVLLHNRPIFENNRCSGSIGLIIDISYRKRMKEEIHKAKEKYREIFENINELWLYHDLEGNLIDTNFTYQDSLSVAQENWIGMNIKQIMLPKHHDEFDQYLRDIQKNGKAAGVLRVRLKEGLELVYEYRSALISDANGPVGARCIALDITKRIEAKRALKASEQRYRSLFEHAASPTIILEDKMLVSMVNAKFVEISGYAKSDVEGKMTLPDFFTDEFKLPIINQLFSQSIELPTEYECRVAHRNGRIIDVLVRLGSIPGSSQKIVSFTDITARKQAETALLVTKEQLQKENVFLRSSLNERYRFGEIIGKSASMQEVYEFILKAAETNANVIIYGESGTGKELVARAIHQMSGRSEQRFVTVHCGAIPQNIIESEFFGYKKGAFTGAIQDKLGYMAYADKGTLFLDEVGEIDLNMQVKLLRVIDGGGYVPLGSNEIRKTDVRIIAATNRNLMDLVKGGTVREDFFYRIHILPVRLPPLRERKDDLPLLIDHFLSSHDDQCPPLPEKEREALARYHWPGNVRELQNVLHRYITLRKLDFPGAPQEENNPPLNESSMEIKDIQEMLEGYEKEIITRALHKYQWRRERVAAALGVNRKTLYAKMIKYGLQNSQKGVI
jgi:PAS domain S-box-containing protein